MSAPQPSSTQASNQTRSIPQRKHRGSAQSSQAEATHPLAPKTTPPARLPRQWSCSQAGAAAGTNGVSTYTCTHASSDPPCCPPTPFQTRSQFTYRLLSCWRHLSLPGCTTTCASIRCRWGVNGGNGVDESIESPAVIAGDRTSLVGYGEPLAAANSHPLLGASQPSAGPLRIQPPHAPGGSTERLVALRTS